MSTTTSFVKLIRKSAIHNGLTLHEGLNCLKSDETFDDRPTCNGGGLYFCRKQDVGYWLRLYGSDLGFVATVTLCPESKWVECGDHKLKADRFLLSTFQPIEEFITAEIVDAAVQEWGWAIQHLPEALRTAEVCLHAVRRTGFVLKDVPAALKTPEICLAAVRHNGWALKHVPIQDRTLELCLAAVQQTGWALQHVPEAIHTSELCLAAVLQAGGAIKYASTKHQTLELCRIAVRQSPLAIHAVPAALKARI